LKKIFLSSLFILILLLDIEYLAQQKQISIIPEPLKVEMQNGIFTFNDDVKVIYNNEQKQIVDLFIEQVSKIPNIKINLNEKKNIKKISFELLSVHKFKTGGYKISLDSEQIKIIASTESGLFYGSQTLIQIINSSSKKSVNIISIPTCTIEDEPRFNWRGMHLDVSRHFFDVDFIKKYLDIMAMHKLNVFHWHLTDDQGWRIEIKKYPKLTEVAAWRKGTGKEEYSYIIEAAEKNEPIYGGYYTQEEVKEIIKYAKDRYITVVPEIELPGHSWSVLSAYPELSCTGTPWIKPKDVAWEFTDPFCAGNEKTFEFFENIFTEVIDLFPSEYIHIGGDEAKKTPWEKCEKCQLRMKENNLTNVEELQSYFIKRIENIITRKGRKIIGWDEILEGGLAEGAAVMSWRGEEGGIEAANLHHNVVMSPGDYLYFNKPQFDSKIENSPYDLLSIKRVYSYDPIPKELDEEKHKFILGAEACLWSEYLYSEESAENRLTPRIAALSEVVWSSKENKKFDNFQKRLQKHLRLLDRNNIKYYISPPTGLEDDLFIGEKYKVEMKHDYNDVELYYTLDNTEPTKCSSKYVKPFFILNSSTIKAKAFHKKTNRSSATITAVIKKTIMQKGKTVNDLLNGLQVKYFIGKIDSLSQFDLMEHKNIFITENILIPKNVREDYYGLEFNGYVKILEEGSYTFYLTSDDGSRLFINEKLIIDNDGTHGMEEKKNSVALAKGYHTIKIIYFEKKYGQGLNVRLRSEKIKKQQIPSSMLYYKN